MSERRCARRWRLRSQSRRSACGRPASQVPREGSTRLIVRPVAPFRLDLTAWALRRRSRNAIDRWDGTTYRRTIVVGERVTELAVRQTSAGATPRLTITATPSLRTTSDRRAVRLIV